MSLQMRTVVSPEHFTRQLEPVIASADPASYGNVIVDNPFLSYFETQPSGFKFPWRFVHRANAKAALHVAPIIETPDGNQFFHLIRVKHPTFNMLASLMFPSGLWGDEGDPNESIVKVIRRELKEETGYQLKTWGLLHAAALMTSPGMTTEQKVLVIAKVTGNRSTAFRSDSETISIAGSLDIPVESLATPVSRAKWMAEMNEKGLFINVEVAAMLGLIDFVSVPSDKI